MKQYEQMTFVTKQENDGANDCIIHCEDRYGNEIHVGDYVRAVCGAPWYKTLEGYVKQVKLIEEAGVFLELATITGKVIAELENPLFYQVETEESKS